MINASTSFIELKIFKKITFHVSNASASSISSGTHSSVFLLNFSILTNLSQNLFRFSCLPLRVVQPLPRLSEIQFSETLVRVLDRPDREVEPLASFSQLLKLRIFGSYGSKSDRAHLRNLAR